jgi:hypothetical protein
MTGALRLVSKAIAACISLRGLIQHAVYGRLAQLANTVFTVLVAIELALPCPQLPDR